MIESRPRLSHCFWSNLTGLLLIFSTAVAAGAVPRNECASPPPGTVFCEDFEGANPKANFDDFDGNPDSENLIVSDLGPAVDPTNKAIRMRVPAGQGGGSDLVKILPQSYDKIYARWYLKYEPGFNFAAPNHGAGLAAGDRNFLGQSGNRPTGTDFASFLVQYLSNTPKPFTYSYYRGMYQDCGAPGSCFGDSFPCVYDSGATYCTKPQHRPVAPLPLFTTGQWYCVEQMVDMGTPTASGAGANGRITLWLDGQMLGDFSDLWIRTTATLKLQILWLSLFHHDGTHSTVGELIDNVVVSTQPIGCGTATGLGALSLSTASQTFANQNIATTSAAQTIAVTNTGTATVNIATIVTSGDFARTTSCGSVLAPAASCNISVTFTPTGTGQRTGSVSITSGAAGSPHSVSLIGTGVGSPGTPTGVTARPGDAQATIYFVPPTDNGGAPITGYNVRCNAGAINIFAQTSPVTLLALANGTPYSCFVTATNIAGEGAPSTSVNVTPAVLSPIFLVAAQSRKTHTGAGSFDLRIDTTQSGIGQVTVEPRAIGTGHTIVFQFNVAVISLGAASALDIASGITTSVPATRSGKEVIVTLAGIADGRRIAINLNGATGPVDAINLTVALGFLLGDVNNTGAVNASDISGVKAHTGQGTTPSSFRFDVSASGAVNGSDVTVVKSRSGKVLP